VTTATRRRAGALAPNTNLDTVARVLEAVPEAIVVIGEDGRIAYASKKLERLCRYARHELVGLSAERLLLEPGRVGGATTCVRKDGACFPATVHVSGIHIGGEKFAVCTIRDESERWLAEEELAQQAMRDPLTGLPNRTLLTDRLDQALRRARRADGGVALLYVDLDWFKDVNDQYGHLAGDAVLREVAARLRTAVRPGDTVARIGGDEFVVLCDPVSGAPAASEIAARVLTGLTQPVILEDVSIDLSASVGVALSNGRSTSRSLVAAADAALYRVKRTGRGRFDIAGSGRATNR
jgi:diguanylate cyclase (GGDEF)-like protein/PAS domain S-box-containing protein